eukprot:1393185-Amorphochlora_amoeboformis.AAC.1
MISNSTPNSNPNPDLNANPNPNLISESKCYAHKDEIKRSVHEDLRATTLDFRNARASIRLFKHVF